MAAARIKGDETVGSVCAVHMALGHCVGGIRFITFVEPDARVGIQRQHHQGETKYQNKDKDKGDLLGVGHQSSPISEIHIYINITVDIV
jgi:hypothetical protein